MKSTTKYFILSFNAVINIVLLVAGTTYYILINQNSSLFVDDYNKVASVAISVGVVCVIALWITFRFTQERIEVGINMCTMIILSLYVALLVVGIYEYNRMLNKELKGRFIEKISKRFIQAYDEERDELKNMFFIVQSSYHCCGIYDKDDYKNDTRLPASCCYECYDCSEKFCSDTNDYWPEGCGQILYEIIILYVSGISITSIILSTLGVASVLTIPFWSEKIVAVTSDKN